MKQFSKADIKYLKHFESHFKTALNSDYVRNVLSADVEKMVKMYYDTFNVKLNYNPNCGNCVLNIIKTVGRKYNEQVNGESGKEEVK